MQRQSRIGSTITEYALIAAVVGAAVAAAISNYGAIVQSLHVVIQAVTSKAL